MDPPFAIAVTADGSKIVHGDPMDCTMRRREAVMAEAIGAVSRTVRIGREGKYSQISIERTGKINDGVHSKSRAAIRRSS